VSLRENGSHFAGVVAASWPVRAVVDSGAGPETVEAQLVSANYFEILGVAPRQGRPFSPS